MIPALYSVLEALRPAFSRQRTFNLVSALLIALIFSGKYTTLTVLFLHLRTLLPGVLRRYWSLPKLLARRQWRTEMLIVLYLEFLRARFPGGFLIGDATSTTTQGLKQQARHFRPNSQYRRRQQNQSKFLAGNSALTVAFATHEQTESGPVTWVFGLGAILLKPSTKKRSEKQTLRMVLTNLVPQGMVIVYDRGGNDAATINRARGSNQHYVTRLNTNAAFYSDPECRQRINAWEYVSTHRGDTAKVYRNELLCYRKKVNGQLKVVVEIFYNRRRRQWQGKYILSTDPQMSAQQMIGYYQTRTMIETVHAESKLLTGFNSSRLHTERSIEGYLSLSILATGILEYLRYSLRHPKGTSQKISTHEILNDLGMHWYHPLRLTRGLVAQYFQYRLQTDQCALSTFRALFSWQIARDP